MSFKPAIALLLLALPLGGCKVFREATSSSTAPPRSAQWREVATEADRDRLRTWRDSWTLALPKARAVDAKTIDGDPALFDPDRAQPGVDLPAGAYRCRTYKLGSQGSLTRDFTAYPWSECRVGEEGEVDSLYKVTGSQRPTGLIFKDTDARLIFLGTLVLGDETSPLRYGTDATRDMAGYVERIGPKRWRLVFPAPRFESLLDVVELVPA